MAGSFCGFAYGGGPRRRRLNEAITYASFPVLKSAGNVDITFSAAMGGEEGGIEIALHEARPISQRMIALGERLLGVALRGVIELAEFGPAAVDFDHRTTDIQGFALQFGDE